LCNTFILVACLCLFVIVCLQSCQSENFCVLSVGK
jgi:hypothetical protein